MKNSELGVNNGKVGLEEIKEQLKLKSLPYSAKVRVRIMLKKVILLHVSKSCSSEFCCLLKHWVMIASSEAVMFCWTCLSPSEVMELQKCQQGLNLDIMRLHIMKSVWPPPLVVMRQKRKRTQQEVGRAVRRRKKCVNVKHLLQNVGRDQEHGVTGGESWHLLFRGEKGFALTALPLCISACFALFEKMGEDWSTSIVIPLLRCENVSPHFGKKTLSCHKKCGSAYSWAVPFLKCLPR